MLSGHWVYSFAGQLDNAYRSEATIHIREHRPLILFYLAYPRAEMVPLASSSNQPWEVGNEFKAERRILGPQDDGLFGRFFCRKV